MSNEALLDRLKSIQKDMQKIHGDIGRSYNDINTHQPVEIVPISESHQEYLDKKNQLIHEHEENLKNLDSAKQAIIDFKNKQENLMTTLLPNLQDVENVYNESINNIIVYHLKLKRLGKNL